MAVNPVADHFRGRTRPNYYFLTFVNNSKDVTDQLLFTVAKVNDWFRKYPSLCKSWMIVREYHKDFRHHYHAIADLDEKQFTPSKFRFKVGKKTLRVHIQTRVYGRFLSTTFSKMSDAAGCRDFINGLSFLNKDGCSSRLPKVTPGKSRRGQFLSKNEALASYFLKAITLGDLERWTGWTCSCKKNHFPIDNYFPDNYRDSVILSNISSYL